MAADSQGPTVNSVAIVFGVMTAIVLSLRLWARIFLVKHIGLDDSQCFLSSTKPYDHQRSLFESYGD